MLTLRKFLLWMLVFTACAALAALIAPLFGAVRVGLREAWSGWLDARAQGTPLPPASDIFFNLRLPRVLLALLAGGGLAVAGVVFQALLRNPLATPYTLGVDSGAACGAVAALFLPARLPWLAFRLGPFTHIQLFAFAGALLAVLMIYLLARGRSTISTLELLLAGVTLGAIFTALILAVRYFAAPQMLVNMDRWSAGGLDIVGYPDVLAMLPFLLTGLIIIAFLTRGFDQLAFGEELAQGRGVNVARLQKLAFLGASLVTASIVSITGPIGFVGLIVPHTVRALVGPDHRLLLPCSLLGGGAFLVVCDTIARTIIAPTELPVGILTSLLGGPFFLYLLVKSRRREI